MTKPPPHFAISNERSGMFTTLLQRGLQRALRPINSARTSVESSPSPEPCPTIRDSAISSTRDFGATCGKSTAANLDTIKKGNQYETTLFCGYCNLPSTTALHPDLLSLSTAPLAVDLQDYDVSQRDYTFLTIELTCPHCAKTLHRKSSIPEPSTFVPDTPYGGYRRYRDYYRGKSRSPSRQLALDYRPRVEYYQGQWITYE